MRTVGTYLAAGTATQFAGGANLSSTATNGIYNLGAGTTSITAGTGFVQRQSVNNKDLATEDLVQGTAGPIAATQTFGAAHRYLAQMVAFTHR